MSDAKHQHGQHSSRQVWAQKTGREETMPPHASDQQAGTATEGAGNTLIRNQQGQSGDRGLDQQRGEPG